MGVFTEARSGGFGHRRRTLSAVYEELAPWSDKHGHLEPDASLLICDPLCP
jgi:hypothetical protein